MCWWVEAADVVGIRFDEPKRTVRTGRDADGAAVGYRDRKLGDRVRRRVDLSEPVGTILGEPEIAVGTGCDPDGTAAGSGDRDLLNRAGQQPACLQAFDAESTCPRSPYRSLAFVRPPSTE